MKKMLIYLLTGLILIGLLWYVTGLLLPAKRQFVRRHTFEYAPETVFAVVTDIAGQVHWRSDLAAIEALEGRPAATWREVPRRQPPVHVSAIATVPNERFELHLEGQGFVGHWTGTFAQVPEGTLCTFVEEVTVERPWMRVVAWLLADIPQMMDLYIRDLEDHLHHQSHGR